MSTYRVLPDLARSLGVSPRTVQKRLARSGLTFRKVQNARRLALARALLLGGDTKITAIASEVGFSSLQHFSVWFKRHTGSRPSELRARRGRH
jgi:AraC-like DNA-binding protein